MSTSSAGLSPDDPWQLAKARFLADLDPDEQALFNHATLENLFYTTSNANRDDAEASRARSASSKLGPFLAAIDNFGKALDIFSSTASLYIAPIWGSIRVLLVLAKTHGKFFDRIVETLERIGDILPRFRDYERIYDRAKHQRLTQALSNAYLEIIVFCTQVRNALRQQKSSSVRRLFKPLSLDREFGEAVNRFRKHKHDVEEEAKTCHMIEAAEERNTQLVLRAVERKAKLLVRLSKVDCIPRHRRLVESRHEGTGLWLTDCESYQKWDSAPNSAVLCCYGIPGSGKSVLASSLIDATDQKTIFYYCDYADKRTLEPTNVFGTLARQLLVEIEPVPEALATEIEKADHDGERMLDFKKTHEFFKTILGVSNTSVRIVFDGLDEASDRSQELILAGFREVIELSNSPVKLVITGREELESSLRIHARNPVYKVPISADAIALDIGAYVQASTKRRIKEGSLVIRNPDLEDIIVKALVEGAKGMFLWVEFQLQDLAEQETDHGIRAVLHNLPRSLSETYDRLLAKIEGTERRRYIERMFRWLVAARQPLRAEEILEGIAFTLDDTSWEREKIPTDFKRFVRACGNLVVVNPDTQVVQLAHYTVQQYILQGCDGSFHFHMNDADASIGEVCIAYLNFTNFDTHITKFKESAYTDMTALGKVAERGKLVSPDNPGRNLITAWNKVRPRNTTLASVDMAKFMPIRKPAVLDMKPFALLEYARVNWLWHCREFTVDNVHDADSHQKQRDTLFTNLIFWRESTFEFRSWKSFSGSDNENKVQLMALLGWALMNDHGYLCTVVQGSIDILHTAADIFLASWPDVSTLDANLPFLEILEGSIAEETLRTYLEESYVDELPSKLWLYSKLVYACRTSHLLALKACLRSFPTTDLIERSVLEHLMLQAASFGQMSVIRFIYSISNPTGRLCVLIGSRLLNALDQAVLGGHMLTVSFLFEKGCRLGGLYHDDESFVESVNLAIESDNPQLLEVLLFLKENHPHHTHPGLAINLTIHTQTEMIILATRLGHCALVEMMVSNGINIGPGDNEGLIALVLAASLGHVPIVNCLNFGVESLNTTGFYDHRSNTIYLTPTPLYTACFNGHLEMVRFLVAAGADTHLISPTKFATVKIVGNDLVRAQSKVPGELTGIFWADIGMSDYDFLGWQYPIAAAMVQKHFDIAQFLLCSGAPPPRINVLDFLVESQPEDWATLQAYQARLSLESGIDVQLEIEPSPLFHKEVDLITTLGNQLPVTTKATIFRALILAGADVDMIRPSGMCCLLYAISINEGGLVLTSSKDPDILLSQAIADVVKKGTDQLAAFLVDLGNIRSPDRFAGFAGCAEVEAFIRQSSRLRKVLLDLINTVEVSDYLRCYWLSSSHETLRPITWIVTLMLSTSAESDERISFIKWCSLMLAKLSKYKLQEILENVLQGHPYNIEIQENTVMLVITLDDDGYMARWFLNRPQNCDLRELRMINDDTPFMFAIRQSVSSGMMKAIFRHSDIYETNAMGETVLEVANSCLNFNAIKFMCENSDLIDYTVEPCYTVVCRCIALGDIWQDLRYTDQEAALIFGENTFSIAEAHCLKSTSDAVASGVVKMDTSTLKEPVQTGDVPAQSLYAKTIAKNNRTRVGTSRSKRYSIDYSDWSLY